jgi:hypothetical protein
MTKRNATSGACSNGDQLTYDVEKHLTQGVKGATTTNFAYNGDGTRVKREVVGTGTMYYIGNYFEVYVPNSGTTTFNKYYYFGSQRVAAKIGSTLFYFQGDHLGSSSVVMPQAGTSFYSRQTYFPYGAQRTTEGSALPTDYTDGAPGSFGRLSGKRYRFSPISTVMPINTAAAILGAFGPTASNKNPASSGPKILPNVFAD